MAKKAKTKKTAKKTTKKTIKYEGYLTVYKTKDELIIEGDNLSPADIYAIGKTLSETAITNTFTQTN